MGSVVPLSDFETKIFVLMCEVHVTVPCIEIQDYSIACFDSYPRLTWVNRFTTSRLLMNVFKVQWIFHSWHHTKPTSVRNQSWYIKQLLSVGVQPLQHFTKDIWGVIPNFWKAQSNWVYTIKPMWWITLVFFLMWTPSTVQRPLCKNLAWWAVTWRTSKNHETVKIGGGRLLRTIQYVCTCVCVCAYVYVCSYVPPAPPSLPNPNTAAVNSKSYIIILPCYHKPQLEVRTNNHADQKYRKSCCH